ncbi:HNH endonuclease signature motif containing protein [Microbacterium sp. cf046]|uniref:HNH endonuclease n=1 Tax=Microbacterium sp. cf046 TaxID=1761803 RepID=UPI000B861088|nr:HNH endonuclease signature motif containing protein [Microbacterium sp. cf046]
MTRALDLLPAEVNAVRSVWSGADAGSLSDSDLIAVHERYCRMRRMLDADQTVLAAEIARRSRPELGSEGLAKTQGYRNPTALIAATGGTSTGDAARLVKVGEATVPRRLLSGATAPARHPHAAEALDAARLTTQAAAAIIAVLDRVAFRAGAEAVDAAERTLVEQAPGLTMDHLNRVLVRAEAWLDPDGVGPREDERRGLERFTMREVDGMFELSGRLTPEHAAPVKTAIEALVSDQMRTTKDAQRDGTADLDVPRRSVVQMQADALVRLCEHALGCADTDLPLAGATVVVRIDHEDLVDGTGYATVDGITTPVSISTARRMAAGGQIISCVLGGASQILDWGRTRRLFTPTQRLALVERDGGCTMCGAPPGHTKAHHIRWWARDAGPTDLNNGILLCESCHHRIHDNRWDIRIDGVGIRAKAWFIPPPHIDPARTPRLGGRARYDYAA